MLPEQLVGAGELQKRHGDMAVLGLAARHREMVAQRRRMYSSSRAPVTSGGGGTGSQTARAD